MKKLINKALRRGVGLLHKYKRARLLKKSKRRIFIDCGANTCKVLRTFIKRYGDFEFFAFESQPELAGECQKVISENPDTKITFFNKAVWVENKTLDFYLALKWGKNFKGGSTLVTGRNFSDVDYSSPVQVEAIDFSEWLKTNFSEKDYVIIKMDIEGAEYDVLEKVIRDNNHNIIKELIVEFHQHKFPSISQERHNSLVAKIRSFATLTIWH